MRKIYWDSCVVIYRIQALEPWSSRIADLMEPVESARIAVTDLTRLECRLRPLREGDLQTPSVFDRFFARPDIVKIDMTARLFDLATDLRARHRLKTPDALHLAAAISAGCDEFWTNDTRLLQAAAPYLRLLALDSL